MKKYSSNKYFNFSFIGLAIWGFFVSFMGKLVWFYYGAAYGWRILEHKETVENYWDIRQYNFDYSNLGNLINALTTPNFIPSLENTAGQYWGLTPCLYDLFIYCELGIIPFITIVSIGIITGILILRTLLQPPEIKA